ncbi:tripartite-type tricarboxylate transporter receptor subunit TctC [Mitsuaria sp. BK045]|uniref:Bug family tripartite tricarboxylate transporter substrate binding protein n=1 Tax=unclassified Roseateles TaxID=2626991 RepID=UPI00161B629C|nr:MULTISPECIES: tripartite tricarboxylate transporter substrate binding protein [unclassified Roseateles]MBB3293629.1 tripartite-type tricarboxylate transporter receptor subunit TctC [Mitsuaria sp. BK041]MBB3362846.1 tripartite-type tricarboxylate transporter receptor subunit TctC [Mitsuaria sp. BK045]
MTVLKPTTRRRAVLVAAATCAATLAWTSLAQAQTGAAAYPSKPITLLVPFAAASATDQLARALGQAITEQTRIAVVVDNKAGASGMIAAQQVARAAPDGYTVLIATNTTQAANPHLFRKLSYDPVKDFAPVTGLGKGGQVMVVKADGPYRSVADVIARARREPGKVSFGSGSASSRVAGEQFQQLSHTQLLHVPYKSNPPALTDLIGGQVDFMITDTATGLPQIKAGKVRALGFSMTRRSPLLPDVPTLDEAGVKGYDMSYWFAAYVPAGTPAPVVQRLRELLGAALRSAPAKAFFESAGVDAWSSTPEELRAFQEAETRKWGQIIKAAGIEPE